ncbi:MAG TPA: Crp/Fnr family transcriptional regulator [Patescibacteria group bacterium]|nr:Crp/Fnr family transcriptional regulator [Patescibacteria group bacterium]
MIEKTLAGFALFEGMPADILKEFVTLAVERRLSRGDTLFHQDDEGTEAFLIVSGAIRVERLNEDGGRVLLNILGPGEFFGETALLTGNPRMAEAVAHNEALLLVIRQNDFTKMLALHPLMSERLMRMISQRLSRVSVKLEEVGLVPLKERLAGIIVDFAGRFGTDGCINIKLTQSDLAELAISSREHINKLIKSWENEGILRFNRGNIIVITPDKLKELHKKDQL